MIDDPLSLVLWSSWLMAAGMYPVGFLFGSCSECCCSNTTCDGFDLGEVYSRRSGGVEVCGVSLAAGATTITTASKIDKGCKITGTNIAPMTFVTEVDESGGTYTATFSPATLGAVSGCVTVCGRSGLCDATHIPSSEGCGIFGDGKSTESDCDNNAPAQVSGCDPFKRRRSCIRWVCRCYRSTGLRSEENQDISTWYEVTSTTIVGGPTENDLDLANELETQDCGGITIEEHYLSQTTLGDFLLQPADTPGCIVWAFVFYGWVADCETPYTGTPTQHVAADDCYNVFPCTRCD